MAISGKDVQILMWRFVKFSMRCAYTLIKNHPFVSCPVLLFSVLYICFPSFFWISICSSAFLILSVSFTKIYLRHRNAKSFKGAEKNNDAESTRKDAFVENDATDNRTEKRFGRARSVRRRKRRETSRDSSLHTSEDEKNTVCSSTFNSDMVDKSVLREERPKEMQEIEVGSVISNVDCSTSDVSSGLRPELHDTFSGRSRKFGGGGDMEIESSEGTDEEEREANNKAVQWNETDQKNLTELGLSEIERNKRLESLIARRRARKMLSLQVRRSGVKIDNLENPVPMTSLTIPRSNKSFFASQSAGNSSSMPGSAPSVLLPNYNPFDLPYDAQEEKPILTGGSFQLEFKDMTFIRPESVDSGVPIPVEQKGDQQETSLSHDSPENERVLEGLQNSQVKSRLDEKDTAEMIAVESCQSPNYTSNNGTANNVIKEEIPDSKQETDLVSNCKEENSSEVQTKSVPIEDFIDKLSSVSSSEDDVPIYKVDKDAVLRSLVTPVLLRNMTMNGEGGSQIGYVGNNYDPSEFDKNKMQENCYYDKAKHHNHHTSMSSIASDLQVELSEVSSPGLTDDGSILFPDEEFSAYKDDLENESTTGYEDIREKPSHLPQIDENESKDVYNINEDNSVEAGLSRSKESENDVPHELAEIVIGNDATDSLSPFASKAEFSYRSEDHSSSFHSNIKDSFQSSTSNLSQRLSSDNLAFPVMDKVQQLKGDPTAKVSQKEDSEKPEQASYPSLESKGELNTTCNVDDLKVLQNNDETVNSRVTDDIVDPLIEGDRREPTKLSETRGPDSVDYTGSQPEKREEHHSILEKVGKNVNARVSEDIEGDFKDNEQDMMDNSTTIQDNDTRESIQVDEGEQYREELRSSGIRPHSSDHQGRRLLPELVLQQFHIASSASSPRSVLQPNSSLEPSSLSGFSDDTHIEIQQFLPQGVENSMFDEVRGEVLTSPQSNMHLMEDSNSRPLHEESDETLKESSNHSTSTKEANSAESMREDMVHFNEKKQIETNYIREGSSERQETSNLMTSSDQENFIGAGSQKLIHENEMSPNEMALAPEGSSRKLCSPDSTAALSRLSKETDLDLPDNRQQSSNFSPSIMEANYIGSVSKHVIHEDEKKQTETKDIPEVSSNSFSSHDSEATRSKTIEESNSYLPVVRPNEETNPIGSVSEQEIPDRERTQNETKYISEGRLERLSLEPTVALSKGIGDFSDNIPHTVQESSSISASLKEGNSMRSVNKCRIHENEKTQNEAKDIPGGSSPGLSSPDATTTLLENTEQISSRSSTMTNENNELHKHEAENEALPSALLSPIEEANKLNTPIIYREEISQLQVNPSEVTYKEEVSNSVDSKAQASTNAPTSRDTQGTANELQKLGAHEDNTGLSNFPETSNVSQDKYVLTSPDEKKRGFNKPFEEESKISSPKEISGVEPSKSAGENDIHNNHIISPETEITTNEPIGSSIEQELNVNPNTENTVVSQRDGTSKDKILEEAPKV